MGVLSYCYILDGLTDTDVLNVRDVIQKKNLSVKMAVLSRKNNRSRAEVNVLDANVMDLIAKVYQQRYGAELAFVQYGAR